MIVKATLASDISAKDVERFESRLLRHCKDARAIARGAGQESASQIMPAIPRMMELHDTYCYQASPSIPRILGLIATSQLAVR